LAVDEPPAHELSILYRDDALLIVNKPAGLVVHRGWATDRVTALDVARDALGSWVYPAHRLDRQTSGALVFGLSPEIARRLEQAFAHGQVEKRYLALVRGMAPQELRIDHPLAKEKGKAKLSSLTAMRRLADFEVENDETGVTRRYSWLEARPLTGRPHQIRRHLKHISHPIVGDVRYGKAEHNRLFRRRFGLERMVLHAVHVAFPHPVDGRPLAIDAPLPAELVGLLDALRAAAPGSAATTGGPAEALAAAEQGRQRGRPEPLPGGSE
jgi:tRNA pseudouridine65 synthase